MVKSDQVNTDREDVPIIPRDQREVEKCFSKIRGDGLTLLFKLTSDWGRFACRRVMVSLCINSSMYCTGIVMMLLCAENIQNMVGNSGVDLSVACWTLIVAAIITPVMWLGTPKDFWVAIDSVVYSTSLAATLYIVEQVQLSKARLPFIHGIFFRFVAVAAVVVTTVACGVLLGNIAYDGVRLSNVPVQHTVPSVMSTCMAFGPMVFAIGGHPVFPTFQNDMKEPQKFNISVYFSYIIIVSMYLSVSVAAYAVYGSTLEDNILLTVSHGPMLYIVQILITAHLLFGFVIILNPVCQDVEELLGVPKDFTWKRCLLRSAAMIFAVIIAVSVPSFGLVLSLVGGSTMALLTVICPLVFYHKLSSMEGEWAKTHINMLTRILDYIIIVAGFLLGILCTFSSVLSLIVHDPDVPSAVSNSTNITEQS